MDKQIDTVKKLYDWSSEGYGNKGRISISCDALAALCAYATSVGIRAGHMQYHKAMAECRAKAKALRYHNMALAVLPESDYLYDPRFADVDDFGDWESDLIIPEEV